MFRILHIPTGTFLIHDSTEHVAEFSTFYSAHIELGKFVYDWGFSFLITEEQCNLKNVLSNWAIEVLNEHKQHPIEEYEVVEVVTDV